MLQSQERNKQSDYAACAILIAQTIIYSCVLGLVTMALVFAILQRR